MKNLLISLTAFVFFFASLNTLSAQNKDSVEGDFEALQDLYKATGGQNWYNNSGWVGMTHETMGDAWGVNVDSNGRVVHLDLQRGSKTMPEEGSDPSLSGSVLGNNLVGELPESIGNLKKIKYFNVKQNLLTGGIPAQIGQWLVVERILLSGHTREPEIGRYNHPEGAGAVDGKTVYATNVFSGTIPEEVKYLSMLEVFESQQNGYNRDSGRYAAGLSGQVPHEWGDNLKMLLLDSNQFTGVLPELTNSTGLRNIHINGGDISGSLPESWGNFTNLNNMRLSYHELTGDIPLAWEGMKNLQFLLLNNNNLSGNFPDFLFTNGKNPFLNTLRLENNNFTGALPKGSYMEGRFNSGVFSINDNGFTGTLPDWAGRITPQQFGISNNNFSGDLPDIFHDNSAPLYTNLRYFRAFGNQFTGSLPQVNFRRSKFSGIVASNNGTKVTTDLNIDVVYTGTVTDANFEWIRDDNANWSKPWIDYEVTIIVPGGENIVFISNEDTIYEKGYLYARNQVDPSGTEGFKYEIRPAVKGKQIMFNKDSEEAIVRQITGIYNQDLVLDSAVSVDLSGYTFSVSTVSTNLLYINFANNQFDGGIPTEWAGIRTTRDSFFIRVDNNNLSGAVPENVGRIPNLDALDISNNRFSSADLQSILDVIPPTVDFRYTGQNPQPDDGSSGSLNIPELQSPENSATALPLNGNLSWENAGADYYRVQVRLAESPEPIVDVETEGNSYLIDEWAEYEQSYRWRVKSVKGSMESDWSSEWSFTTENEPVQFPKAPIQFSPDHQAENVSLTPEFRWGGNGADYYILHVSRSNPSGMFIDVIVDDTTYIPEEKLDDSTIHDWRVRGVKDGELGEWSDIRRFTTTEKGLPDVAGLVSPGQFEEDVNPLTDLVWKDVQSDSYEIRLMNKQTSDTLISDVSMTASYTPMEALPDTTEFIWQVRSIVGNVHGAWGPRWTFSTGIYDYSVAAPSLVAPGQGSEYNNLIPTFKWESVGADKYNIVVLQDTTANAKVMSGMVGESAIINDETNEPVYTPSNPLKPETVYYWQVQAVVEEGEGEWSEIWEFKTPSEQQAVSIRPDEQPVATTLDQNYPNPFNPTTQVEFTLSEMQEVSIRVYDMAGRQVATLVEGLKQAGRHSATFDASNLSSGIYIYRFMSDSHQFSRKMTLIK